jgi:hypothetical protein
VEIKGTDPPIRKQNMGRHSISKKRYLEVGQVFHWATREHYELIFTGRLGRHGRTEKILPQLVKEKKLIARSYGRRFVYTVPRKGRSSKRQSFQFIEHGLACTECLVRIWLSRTDGEIIAEKHFRKFKIIPEWGIRYPHRVLLLMEFSTEDNFNRFSLMKSKRERYSKNLESISRVFDCHSTIVLFIFDVNRDRVERFVKKNHPTGVEFFFTDYHTFLKAPLRKQLTSPIYIWEDGKSYSLAKRT